MCFALCFLSELCTGTLAGMGAREPGAGTMPVRGTARQASRDESQRAGMLKIIGMVRATQRLYQINWATGGEDAGLQKKPPQLKTIK